MIRRSILLVTALLAVMWAPPLLAQVGVDVGQATDELAELGGTAGTFVPDFTPEAPERTLNLTELASPSAMARLYAPRQDQVQATRGERPPRDPVGGFQFNVFGGVQLRGSASGTGGLALGYFNRASASFGFEVETAFTRGPTGDIVHVIGSVVLQSGARASRMVPYLAIGGGAYRAQTRLRDSVREILPDFGIVPEEESEIGPMIAFGIGVRYYLSPKVSFRADYREFRGLTTGDGGFFDRLYALRRIAGFLSFDL